MLFSQAGVPVHRLALPRVTLRQDKLPLSSRFRDGWTLERHDGPVEGQTSWLRKAWQLIQQSTFMFAGGKMPVVDAAWTADHAARADARTYALCKRGTDQDGVDGEVAAVAVVTTFPAEVSERPFLMTVSPPSRQR